MTEAMEVGKSSIAHWPAEALRASNDRCRPPTGAEELADQYVKPRDDAPRRDQSRLHSCHRTKLQVEGRMRDLAIFNLAIDSKRRGCDVVALLSFV